MLSQQQKNPGYLAINPKGELPTLLDDQHTVVDSNAILVYLATQYGRGWYPDQPATLAAIQYWLSTAANEVHHGLSAARAFKVFGFARNYAEAVPKANATLSLLEARLGNHDWLADDHPTIADIAMYPYAALAEQGEVSLDPYPNTRAWFKRMESLPGYSALPVKPEHSTSKTA